jgi:hypothetical protein
MSRAQRGGEDPWIGWKVRAFSVGAGFAIGALVLDSRALALAAIAVLLLGFGLRFFVPKARVEDEEEEEGREVD